MSATFKQSSIESKREIAKITTRDDVIPMKKLPEGTIIRYNAYVTQDIVKESDGEIFTSITIRDQEGKLYATRSEAFMKRFFEILEMCEDDGEPIDLLITRGTTNAGREFISCALA